MVVTIVVGVRIVTIVPNGRDCNEFSVCVGFAVCSDWGRCPGWLACSGCDEFSGWED